MKIPSPRIGALPRAAGGWRDAHPVFPGRGAVRPQTNGSGGEKVNLPGGTTLRPDPSRYKSDELVETTFLTKKYKLTCPCIGPNGEPLNGIKYVKFLKGTEGMDTLLCPTQRVVCDPGRPLPNGEWCRVESKTAKARDFDYIEKPT